MYGLALEFAIIVALILVNGLLAMSEISFVAARRIRLQQRAEAGDEGARTALALAEEPTRFLTTIQIGISLVGIIASAFGGASTAGRIATWLEGAGLGGSLSYVLGFGTVVLIITYLSLVIGEIVPKRIGLSRPELFASLAARPIILFGRLTAPFGWIVRASTAVILKLIRVTSTGESAVTEEELRLQIAQSAQGGTMAQAEAELLDRVFHFGDRKVHEVMVPRTEVVWLDRAMHLRDFYSVYTQTPHSRFPVIDRNPDNVVGILGIKDVLAALSHRWIKDDSDLRPLVRPAMFVPETKPIGELFREMQQKGVQMAIAVDEFGGTAGIVTLEQLLEEMVGPVGDELRPQEVEIQTIDDRTKRVDGSLSIEEARDELGLDIPEGPYDTVAGFVLNELGHIPEEGEELPYDGYGITVEEMRGPKIERLTFTKL